MVYSKPYRKDSGIKIDKDNPYFTYPGRRYRRAHDRAMRPRKNAYCGEILQVVATFDSVHNKWINQKRIIHTKKTSWA